MVAQQEAQRQAMRSAPRDFPLPHDIERFSNLMVNLYFVGERGAAEWTVIDAGLPLSAPFIMDAAARRFGRHDRPNAIVLTHGHFDHVGSLIALAQRWDVP